MIINFIYYSIIYTLETHTTMNPVLDAADWVQFRGDVIDKPEPLRVAYWNFGNVIATLKKIAEKHFLCLEGLSRDYIPLDEWSVEEFDQLFTLPLPDGFEPKTLCFYEAESNTFVMVFGADGETAFIYDFNTGMVVGGGNLPEAISWDEECLSEVFANENDGSLSVVLTRDGANRTIVVQNN